jgi:hypothetical protein
MELVSYESTTKILSINGTEFDLNKYTIDGDGVFNKNEPTQITVRNKICNISLGENVQVNKFYNGNTYEFALLNAAEVDNVTETTGTTLKNILQELKNISQKALTDMIPKSNTNAEIDEDTFTKLLSVVMLATKILTGVLILQKVSKASCKFIPERTNRQTELDKKIQGLEAFLKNTSSLLFKMDVIKVE